MRPAERLRYRPGNVGYLAGWLFADLLLVLFITTFAATTLAPKPVKHPGAHPTPTPTHHLQVLILRPHRFTLTVPGSGIVGSNGRSAADRSLAADLEKQLREQGLSKVRAGLVQAFGWSPLSSGDGTQVAKAANLAVTRNLPLFRKARTESYWHAGSDGSVSFIIFFFARG